VSKKKEDPLRVLAPILDAIKKGRDNGPSEAAQVRFVGGLSLLLRFVPTRSFGRISSVCMGRS
jgi:hypothetical protein